MSECLTGLLWRMDVIDFLRWLSCGSSRMTVGWTIRMLQDGYQKEPISDPGRNLSIRVLKSSMCWFPEGTAMSSYLFKCSMILVMTSCSRFRISRWLLRDSCVRVFQHGRQETLLSGCSKMASSDLFTRVFSKMDATKIKQTLSNNLTMNLSHMYGVMQVFRSCIWSAWDLTFWTGTISRTGGRWEWTFGPFELTVFFLSFSLFFLSWHCGKKKTLSVYVSMNICLNYLAYLLAEVWIWLSKSCKTGHCVMQKCYRL